MMLVLSFAPSNVVMAKNSFWSVMMGTMLMEMDVVSTV